MVSSYGTTVNYVVAEPSNDLQAQPPELIVHKDKAWNINHFSKLSLLLMSVLVFLGWNHIHDTLSTPLTVTMNDSYHDEFSFFCSNEYTNLNTSKFPYPFLSDAHLMEPHRNNTVNIISSNSLCSYKWTMISTQTQSTNSIEGNVRADAFVIVPVSTGKYKFTIVESCGDLEVELISTVWVKYVRRELQTLTDYDREEFLDAMQTLWSVNTLDGQHLYGDGYKSLFYLATVHNDGGGNSVCDQFHANTGFLNNHVMLGAYLEQSLQMVNPRVALHYMEYTKYFSSSDFTQHVINQLDGGNWTEILSAKYFGSNDPYSGQILDGRWAGSGIPYLSDDYFASEGIDPLKTFFPDEESQWLAITDAHVASPYGLLRSPWNYHPANYMVRYHNINLLSAASASKHVFKPYMGSTCSDYETFVKTYVIGQSMQSYLTMSEAQVHGKIHFTFGGAGGDHCVSADDSLQELYGFSESDLVVISAAAQTFFKTYIPLLGVNYSTSTLSAASSTPSSPLNCSAVPWQHGMLTATAWPGEQGGPTCTCSLQYFDSEESLDELIQLFFKDFVNDADTPALDLLSQLAFGDRSDAMQIICSRFQFDGDMAGSGAATDPLFWVAHGAVERLFQRIIFEDVLTDKLYKSSRRSTCSGHAANGTKSWLTGFELDGYDGTDAATLSNEDILNMLDPTSDAYRDHIPFVYDSGEWTWCEGFDSWFSS